MKNTFNVTAAIDEARVAIEAARESYDADGATVQALDALLKVTAALHAVVRDGQA